MNARSLDVAPPANTDLIRLAWLTPGTSYTERRPAIADLGRAKVSEIALVDYEGNELVLVEARLRLTHFPKVDRDGRVVVPARERKAAEGSIDFFADLYSVANRLHCRMSSPVPSVFFHPQDDRSRRWFDQVAEIHDDGALRGLPDPWVPVDVTKLPLDLLVGRADGVQLIAEGVSSEHATGRFHELIRFFERAFATPSSKLAHLVLASLDPRFGYTAEEVDHWFALRDPASHADKRRTFVTAADVLPSNGRMMQAAYDLLFNKRDWIDPTTERRDGWNPPVGTTSAEADMLLTRGEPFEAKVQLLDEFGVYHWNVKHEVATQLPNDWWPYERSRATTSIATGSIRVEGG